MVDVGAAVRRLALREYAPWLGVILTWAMIALAVGHADAARLFAASAFVRCARSLTGPTALVALRRQRSPEGAINPAAVRGVLIVEALALLAGFAVAAVIILLLAGAGQDRVAMFCALLAVGLPPRYLLPFAAARRVFPEFRFTATWGAALLVALAWLLGASPFTLALVFATREWLALIVVFAFAPALPPRRRQASEFKWQEIAARTAAFGRRRLSYRLGKGVMSILLGPAGGVAARTGRGLRLHHRLERFTPQRRLSLLLLGLSTTVASIAIVLFFATPATLVAAASLLMVASVAANVLVWSWLAASQPDLAYTDDEDEDE